MQPERPVQIAVCEQHGLKYNAATESGCVRCRRDAAPAASSAPAPPRPPSAALQLALAALLVAGTGALFCAAQRAILDGYTILHRAAERGEVSAPAVSRSAEPTFGVATAGQTTTAAPSANAAAEAQRQLQQLQHVQQLLQQVREPRAPGADQQPR